MTNTSSLHFFIFMFMVSFLGQVFLIFILIIFNYGPKFFLIDDVLIVMVYNSIKNSK